MLQKGLTGSSQVGSPLVRKLAEAFRTQDGYTWGSISAKPILADVLYAALELNFQEPL